jgi:hypothetical protein
MSRSGLLLDEEMLLPILGASKMPLPSMMIPLGRMKSGLYL